MNEWYMGLSPRERNIVTAAGILLLIAAFYAGIWDPMHSRVDTLNRSISTAQKDLVWMQEKAQEVKALTQSNMSKGPNKRASMSLNQAVSSTASRFKVTLDEIASAGQDTVSVRIREAQYDDVMRWVFELESSYLTEINSISISQGDESGVVTVRMKIEDLKK